MKDEKALKLIVGAVNVLGIECLCRFGYSLIIHDTRVPNPDAMLPAENWDGGGFALLIGLIPLWIVNILAFKFIGKDRVKMPARLLFLLPGAICSVLVAYYLIYSFTM